ncbi:purine/pyrimidine permease [Advenella sp. WQ 585]|uniref:Purine/pyrimidine permease n=1 Tax=Advenella mandrilli TaxID=2800330 RepID=A0ABS1EH22_9BURK|nr:solute carrier family 23 protein [Advenella mandrilli]MBK1782306.1 purine/pyrimidine permease [Advenella mandrilli]
MKYQLEDKPRAFPMLMYGVQWFSIAVPSLLIIGSVVAVLQGRDIPAQIMYMQKLFAVCGLVMFVQVLWGHKLPLIIGPASVLLLGIVAGTGSDAAIYSSIGIGGACVALLAFSGGLGKIQKIFTTRVVVVILVLVAVTLSPLILRLSMGETGNSAGNLVFSLLLALMMLLGNKWLPGVWKSMVVLLGLVLGSLAYFSFAGWPGSLPALLPWLQTGPLFLSSLLWHPEFDLPTLLAFFFSFIALMINELGSIQGVGAMLGASNMPERSKKGMGITGLGNVMAGFFGVIGPIDYSMSPGVIAATQCASRYPLVLTGLLLVLCSWVPGIIGFMSLIPAVVMGAALLYVMTAQLAASLQMLVRDKGIIDFYSGVTVAFPVMLSILIAFLPPGVVAQIPAMARPIVGNGFIMGCMAVLFLEHTLNRRH